MVTSVNNQEISQNDLVTRLRKEMKIVVLGPIYIQFALIIFTLITT